MRPVRRRTKIIVAVLTLFVGMPAAMIVMLLRWAASNDLTNGVVFSEGRTRHYLLHVPESYDGTKPTPLVISMHPAAGWPAMQMRVTGWNVLADEHGFLVVYPAGVDLRGGSRSGPRIWRVRRDAVFIADLIDKIEAEYNIDPARIYVDGYSQGGGLAFAVSCKLGDRIAAVGTVAAAQELSFDWCGAAPPLPMIAFHGTDDLVPYYGGKSPDPFNPVMFPAVTKWTADWARRNRCAGEPLENEVAPDVRRLAYAGCADHADVVLYTLVGGGHTWPGGESLPEWLVGRTSTSISASRVMWDFFSQHPRAPGRSEKP